MLINTFDIFPPIAKVYTFVSSMLIEQGFPTFAMYVSHMGICPGRSIKFLGRSRSLNLEPTTL